MLLLTKPLGVGIICTAGRIGEASDEAMEGAVQSMIRLNRRASEIVREYRVHGCTDVTGFGFLGHLKEMLGDSFSAVIDSEKIPRLPMSLEYAGEFYLTAAAQRNRNHLGDFVEFQGVSFEMEELLFDPQTSGGLLISLPEEDAKAAAAKMEAEGICCGIVGRITREETQKILVKA